MKFFKYQALGNDYLIFPEVPDQWLRPPVIQRICNRHFGLGSDGILLPVAAKGDAIFGLRIFNPDGSEAEKSGNGLRIFARYLYDQGYVSEAPFSVETPGGIVRCAVLQGGRLVFVEMGSVSFFSEDIPLLGPPHQVVDEALQVGEHSLRITALTVGNPHCVIPLNQVGRELACELGPQIEQHPLFPQRTNVQFLQVLDRQRIRIEIWERGAGYTLASGSSSCAAAAAAVRLGLCSSPIQVEMPGGHLEVTVSPTYETTLLGPARQVAQGCMAEDLLNELKQIA